MCYCKLFGYYYGSWTDRNIPLFLFYLWREARLYEYLLLVLVVGFLLVLSVGPNLSRNQKTQIANDKGDGRRPSYIMLVVPLWLIII
jgi:hypothetical protein